MKACAKVLRRSTATRCMALLVGLHFQGGRRISREDLARSLRRSVRTVFTVIRQLENRGWIEVSGGGNGTPGIITVINDLSWKTADVADVSSKTADDWPKTADVSRHIRALEVLQGKGRVSPSQSVEKPPDPAMEEWHALERFAAERKLDLSNGADFERAYNLMHERKPAQSEVGLCRAAGAR